MEPQYLGSNALVVFTLDGGRYALPLSSVKRVIPAIEITPLPQAPGITLGVINIRGEILPVVNIRKRFRLPEREVDLGDQIILGHTSRRSVAMVVDTVSGVMEAPKERVVIPDKIAPNLRYIEGVVKLEDGIVLIHDLDKFLSLEEEQDLDAALKSRGI